MLKFGLNRLNYVVSSGLVKSQKRSIYTRLPLKWSTSHITCMSIYYFSLILYLDREDQVPRNTDVLVIGGGIMGWATAFWLRRDSKFSVTVVEKDPTYSQSATVLGLGSIRQQFSEPENIQMSLFSIGFLRNVSNYLSVEGLKRVIL